MKYFVAYPISFDCDLHCSYCFHSYKHGTNYGGSQGETGDFCQQRRMTFADWFLFRDTHLKGAEDIIIHFHGGETFLATNTKTIESFMRNTSVERVDLLTNGLQDKEMYRTIENYASRVHRIGMTFHRKVMGNVPELVEKFEKNAELLREIVGDRLYIKELLFPGTRETLQIAKKSWEARGYRYKIQDFKGTDRGRDFEEWRSYTAEDILAIDSEYKRGGAECACTRGYTNILIRGGWNEGDILACFEDPVVVGSIQRNEYHTGYKIVKDFQAGKIDVQGVPKNYKGNWERDLYKSSVCGID